MSKNTLISSLQVAYPVAIFLATIASAGGMLFEGHSPHHDQNADLNLVINQNACTTLKRGRVFVDRRVCSDDARTSDF